MAHQDKRSTVLNQRDRYGLFSSCCFVTRNELKGRGGNKQEMDDSEASSVCVSFFYNIIILMTTLHLRPASSLLPIRALPSHHHPAVHMITAPVINKKNILTIRFEFSFAPPKSHDSQSPLLVISCCF